MTKQKLRDVRASLIQMRAPAFFVVLAVTLTVGLSIALRAQPELTPAAVQADFDALWRDVSENYAYFDSRQTDWSSVPD